MSEFNIDKVTSDVIKAVTNILGQTVEINSKSMAFQMGQYVAAYKFLKDNWDDFEPDTRMLHEQQIQDSMTTILKGYEGVSAMAAKQAVNAAFEVIIEAAGEFIRLL